MLGALSKTYWANQVKKIDPKNVVNVAVMPCAAKKIGRASCRERV